MSHLFSDNITVIGFGSQAKAWALNLRDSGFNVSIWLREGSQSGDVVKALEFNQVSSFSPIVLLLIPDNQHHIFLEEQQKALISQSAIIYGHGASCTQHKLGKKYPQFNHLLLAPKAIASEVRFQFETGGNLGACSSTEFARADDLDACTTLLKNLARGIGITAGPFQTKFSEEAYADLFSEQSLLCGLLPYAAKKSYDHLRKKGISEEVAYMECWLEVRLIASAMLDYGPKDFFNLISPHALIGGEKAQRLFFDKAYQNILEKLYNDIETGHFFEEADSVNVQELKEQVQAYWAGSELQKVHDRLSDQLI
jgi:ketol-acid reductoisomerase